MLNEEDGQWPVPHLNRARRWMSSAPSLPRRRVPGRSEQLHGRDGERAACVSRFRHHPRDRRIDPDQERGRSVEATELSDIDELGELQAVEAQLAELLAEDDVEHLAAAMEPGSNAGVLTGRTCGSPFAQQPRPFGWRVDCQRTIPIQAIIASIEADEAPHGRRLTMPLRPARVGRVGVIGAGPVAKTAVVARCHTWPGSLRRAKIARASSFDAREFAEL